MDWNIVFKKTTNKNKKKEKIMSKVKLEELKEDLKLAKEANDLTISNIGKIVSEATSNIIKELRFNKEMTSDIVNDVVDNTTTVLKELGEDTAENIKASKEAALNGVQDALKIELSDKAEKMEKVYNTLSDDIKEDMKETFDNFKAFGELSLDILQGAIKGAKEVLEEKQK